MNIFDETFYFLRFAETFFLPKFVFFKVFDKTFYIRFWLNFFFKVFAGTTFFYVFVFDKTYFFHENFITNKITHQEQNYCWSWIDKIFLTYKIKPRKTTTCKVGRANVYLYLNFPLHINLIFNCPLSTHKINSAPDC